MEDDEKACIRLAKRGFAHSVGPKKPISSNSPGARKNTCSTHEPGKEYRNAKHGNVSRHRIDRRAVAMPKVTMVMYRATVCAVLCRAVLS